MEIQFVFFTFMAEECVIHGDFRWVFFSYDFEAF